MIAFQHARPKKGESPCDAGFQIWVMNADATDARQVTPAVAPGLSDWSPRWTADGSSVVYESYDGLATTKLNGTQRRLLAGGLGQADLDRDGSRAAVTRSVMGEVNGQRGEWRQLLLEEVAAGNHHVLVQQFVSDSQAGAHLKRVARRTPPGEDVARVVGPKRPRWSPDGRQIAFLAALPFNPKGPPYREQVEVWIYDLATKDLIQITEDQAEQSWLSWR
jgi:Tol biopolymer transport system component